MIIIKIKDHYISDYRLDENGAVSNIMLTPRRAEATGIYCKDIALYTARS